MSISLFANMSSAATTKASQVAGELFRMGVSPQTSAALVSKGLERRRSQIGTTRVSFVVGEDEDGKRVVSRFGDNSQFEPLDTEASRNVGSTSTSKAPAAPTNVEMSEKAQSTYASQTSSPCKIERFIPPLESYESIREIPDEALTN